MSGKNAIEKLVSKMRRIASELNRIQFVEYGGWVVNVPGGGFTYKEIIGPERKADGRGSTPGSVQLGEPPPDAVASFHTHPRRGSESLDTFGDAAGATTSRRR